MALIICPECGKEISDKIDNCIHCGCPLIKIKVDNIQVFQILNLIGNEYNKNKNQWAFVGDSNCDFINIGDYVDLLDENNNIIMSLKIDDIHKIGNYRFIIIFKNTNDIRLNSVKHIIKQGYKLNLDIEFTKGTFFNSATPITKIKCPTCSSTNVHRITAGEKATNIAMFGLLGNKRKMQFHCNNCKYMW